MFVLHKLSESDTHKVLQQALDRIITEELAVDYGATEEHGGHASSAEGYEVSNASARTSTTSASTSRAFAWITDEVLRWISNASDGDARTALGALELALTGGDAYGTTEDNMTRLKQALRRSFMHYDRAGDAHYDTISALHKSIRGSDPDAALYWLARMVVAGDDPLFIARRLIVCASEDCCSAEALQLAIATYSACQIVGLPECGINLSHCVVVLAEAPKSTRSYRAWKRVLSTVDEEHSVRFC